MYFDYLWIGLIIGLATTIPAGPVGVLVVQRTLSKGRISGFFSGIGAATADGFFSFIAGFSISLIMDFVLDNQFVFKIIAIIILLALSLKLLIPLNNNKPTSSNKLSGKNKFGDYLSAMLLTLSNPMGIFGFAGLFAGFKIVENASYIEIVFLILVIMLSATLGWFLLTFFINKFRSMFSIKKVRIINKIAGFIILLFCMAIVISLFTG